jgi:membrane protein insertase Oxa1/YidC/SpoIIIJ
VLIFPLSYQQIASTQMTQALNPKVQEIKEKYAGNKDLQNQMTALLYQETKVIFFKTVLECKLDIRLFATNYL